MCQNCANILNKEYGNSCSIRILFYGDRNQYRTVVPLGSTLSDLIKHCLIVQKFNLRNYELYYQGNNITNLQDKRLEEIFSDDGENQIYVKNI